jgi:hypothetical protein
MMAKIVTKYLLSLFIEYSIISSASSDMDEKPIENAIENMSNIGFENVE